MRVSVPYCVVFEEELELIGVFAGWSILQLGQGWA